MYFTFESDYKSLIEVFHGKELSVNENVKANQALNLSMKICNKPKCVNFLKV